MAETVLHQAAQFGFLGVSASNVLGQLGPATLVCFGRGTCLSSENGDGGSVPLPEKFV